MQKKLIALAVAGLASSAVFAQSNVTIYGVADVGLVIKTSQLSGTTNADGGQKFGIQSGVKNGSRLGFKGTDDLGGGLKSFFLAETGMDVDTGGFGTGGGLFMGRQIYAGLEGGFGRVQFGRQYAPIHLFADSVDPFGTGTAGSITNLFNYPVRINNAATYITPNMGGFDVKFVYSKNAAVEETRLQAKNTNTLWAINPVYSNGPLTVGLNYHQIDPGNGNPKAKNTTVAGKFNFGAATLHALWNQNKKFALPGSSTVLLDGTASDRSDLWMLGVTAPVSNNMKLQFSYNRLNDKGVNNADANQIAVGGVYDLSKRTNLYAAYAKIKNKNNARNAVGNATDGPGAAGDGNQGAFNLGMQHWF